LLNRRFGAAWRALRDFRHTRAQWSALVDATFSELIETRPSETFFANLFDRFAAAEAWRVYEDVFPTLEVLFSRGIKLGIISNWDDRLRPLLRKLKLDGYFEAIVVSCEVDSPKPATRIFLNAASALGVKPEAILHVGDDAEMDLHGARAAGLQSVLIKRGAKRAGRDHIRSLRELC
jgi:putative hydrolase of the HAD superfamily